LAVFIEVRSPRNRDGGNKGGGDGRFQVRYCGDYEGGSMRPRCLGMRGETFGMVEMNRSPE